MKAMILAAGLGTRLRPLTDTRPKALVEINGRTLLEITLARLHTFGINEVIINVHHFADMVVDYLKSKSNFGMRIEISHEDDLLLDTGGGLKKAAWFFLEEARHSPLATRHSPTEPFLLHNVDVISTIDLRRMLQFHNEHSALGTLAVQSRESSRLLLFNDHLQLVGRAAPGKKTSDGSAEAKLTAPEGRPSHPVIPGEAKYPGTITAAGRPSIATGTGSGTVISSEARTSSLGAPLAPRNPSSLHVDASPHVDSERSEECASTSNSPLATCHSPLSLAFSGIHMISPRFLSMLTEEGVFSIIDSYLRLAAQGEKILAFRADEYYWRDLGRPADLSQAAADVKKGALEQ